ncbi:MAG: outer membrane protein assembly factor BamD [Desulfobacterales bacterium]|nr:outer membrane protein assembly factor BamD [Desulfobacterales bacterium]
MSAAFVLMLCGCTTLKETYADVKGSISGLFGGSDENQTAEELAWAGMDYYDGGDYKKAIDHFQRLKDIYPFSQYAILAELKLGDAHYKLEQYEDAIFAYEEFEKLHPRNEAVPYVIYQIGRSHFDRITTSDRDQTYTRKAMETFQRLIRQYPDSPYARSAAEHVVGCYKSLAGHDFGVGVFYFKSKHYPAALARFRSVVSDYPDVGYHQQALDFIARTESKMAETGISEDSSGTRSGT